MNQEPDISFVDDIVKKIGREPHSVIPILQAIQQHYRYLPEEALKRVCECTDITPTTITGVSTFYSQFRHRPIGRHVISVCTGTACHVKGADLVFDALRRHLQLEPGRDTDAKGLFTLQTVACLGCCTLAPAVQIDDITYGHLTGDNAPRIIHDFLEWEKSDHQSRKHILPSDKISAQGEIRLGLGSCCVARGSGKLHEALLQALADTAIPATIKHVGCVGMCHQTPLLEIVLPNTKSFLYARVQPEDALSILLRHFKPSGLKLKISNFISRSLDNILTENNTQPITRYAIDVRDQPVAAFLDQQKNIATEYCGDINPLDLDEYLSCRGFQSLKSCLHEKTPEQIIEQIQLSQLRGRGGAGFPTGVKWATVRRAPGPKKYIICNGDEGDPGAFMDRMLLESYPYRIIEGMAIAARAVGADEGIFYIRAEYPLAVRRIRQALQNCLNRRLLGQNIFDSDFCLNLHIMEGAGAFVCGEETALMASIEGRRGMPSLRPPYPAEKGLWNQPTLVNNAETFALVPWILRNGADAFSSLGTETSKGTKVFALAGKVVRGGLIEVPMGISLRQIVEDIGGGVPSGKHFKAVQVGGPSGGCIPAELAHVPVDYEALTNTGAIMGSGGLVVLDDSDCMVEIARYFLEFTQNQSCGKCTYCRIGTRRMLDILERLCSGQGQKGDLENLEQLAHQVQKGSLCGLGRTAPNPVLSTLRYFRDEYEAHLQGRCPAGKCKDLITYSITDNCIGCTLCAQRCPTDAIFMKPYEKHEIDSEKCVRCGTCMNICPADAVISVPHENVP